MAAIQSEIVNINKFNFAKLPLLPNIAVIGKRALDKASLVHDLMHKLHDTHHYYSSIVFDPFEAADPFFTSFVPASNIFNELDANVLEEVIKTQKAKADILKHAIGINLINRETPVNFNTVVVISGSLLHKNIENVRVNTLLRELLSQGSEFGISVIITARHLSHINPAFYEFFDWVFAFESSSDLEKQKLFEFFGGNLDAALFREVLEESTSVSRKCLGIRCTGSCLATGNAQTQLYWYSPEVNIPKFVFGKKYILPTKNVPRKAALIKSEKSSAPASPLVVKLLA
ncbi:hypothetical protein BCR32DRAFT_273894 [Anaeromyces robustus]|jgi:hypothetical protein|uniref:Uncharacterized protein n=1 Tax=Anaeromyces robustus TaxID=1754192 RepID=A0A1Y1XQQ8_9FUNG|nr:hypothetical protein BCR32DRAFT_273894 [Anaeromyces robustus]|eukprot:ORX88082.1 hypothetical protein BCR32DRAFT_273894 [Anaeromyces robustus]